jgi:hypothetical protein
MNSESFLAKAQQILIESTQVTELSQNVSAIIKDSVDVIQSKVRALVKSLETKMSHNMKDEGSGDSSGNGIGPDV